MLRIQIYKNYWNPLRTFGGSDHFYSLIPKFDDDPGYPVKFEQNAFFLLPKGYFVEKNNFHVPVILNYNYNQCFIMTSKKGPYLVDFDKYPSRFFLKQVSKWSEKLFNDHDYQEMLSARRRVMFTNSHKERMSRLLDAARH